MTTDEARRKIIKGQAPLLAALLDHLDANRSGVS
jgi:predicted NUDIX family NTP pyrophosphohydrolase